MALTSICIVQLPITRMKENNIETSDRSIVNRKIYVITLLSNIWPNRERTASVPKIASWQCHLKLANPSRHICERVFKATSMYYSLTLSRILKRWPVHDISNVENMRGQSQNRLRNQFCGLEYFLRYHDREILQNIDPIALSVHV